MARFTKFWKLNVSFSDIAMKNFGKHPSLNFRRFRYKAKWATSKPQKSPTALALEYFDTYYQPVYKDLWPSIRLSLLSQQKYSALVNNFAETDDVVHDLLSYGADDIFKYLHESHVCDEQKKTISTCDKDRIQIDVPISQKTDHDPNRESEAELKDREDRTDIHRFVAVEKVVSDICRQQEEERLQGFLEADDLQVKVVPDDKLKIPYHLKLYACERGDVSLFPPAKSDITKKLGYYLLDASSILPILALDLQLGCSVLDLCAAPGGKTLAMIQTMLPDNITCLDHSWSRLTRLKEVMKWYIPRSYVEEQKLKIIHNNAIEFCLQSHKTVQFDKVLVDAPCYTDRHVVNTDIGNMFKNNRMQQRLDIQNVQKELLYGGILSCRPGGTIVYSTCTLSAPQNDGIIQAVLEKIWQTTNIDVVVKDTSHFRNRFQDIFDFYTGGRFGQQVLPCLTANFGPSYFCKLERLN